MAGFHTKTFLKHDDYMTPKYAWENIKHLIPENIVIYEPFYGDGKSGEILTELLPNNNIIHEEIDFFEHYINSFDYDMVISNPPFTKYKEILTALLEADKPFILIMPSSKINTQTFRTLFKNKNDKLQIIIPRTRIHFEKKVDGDIPIDYKSSCNFDCFYYCYKINLDRDIVWLE